MQPIGSVGSGASPKGQRSMRWVRAGLAGGLLSLAFAHGGPFVAWVGNVPVHTPSPDACVMVADVAGGVPVNVSEGLAAARDPSWAPDGSRLVFEALQGACNDLFLCAPDGSGRVNLTETPELWEASGCFAGAGRVACLTGTDRTEIWLLTVGTRERARLAAPAAFHSRPVPSPDGSLLAVFAADRLAGPGRLLVVPADGSAARALPVPEAVYSAPSFTPDGRRLVAAFDGGEIGGVRRGLAVLSLDGDPPEVLADDAYPWSAVSVSGDGRRVAYTSAAVYHDTWVSLADTNGDGRRGLGVSGFHNIGWPGFLPDGRRLVFEGVYAARFTVNLVDLETGEVRALTPAGQTGVHPVVSPR